MSRKKFVSIMGDSISTYEGYNPQGYSVYYDADTADKNGMASVYDTWWAKVNQKLKAYLCVNDSYSGSKVSGDKFPSACCDIRTSNLHIGDLMPDYILIYIGFNDFGNGVLHFQDAYNKLLQKIKVFYPETKVICGTLMRSKLKNNIEWEFPENYAGVPFAEYNMAIREVSRKNGCLLADLERTLLRYETLDGSHPTAKGHITIANAWIQCLGELL